MSRFRTAALCALLVLLTAPGMRSMADSTAPDDARLVGDFHRQDLLDLQQHFPARTVMSFTPVERNAAALLAAQTLTEADGSDTQPTYSAWHQFVANRWHYHTSVAYGMKFYSVALLRDLSERRGVTTPEIIPDLIHALNHPDRYSIGQPAFYALVYLTGHRSGERYWSRLVEDEPGRRATLAWWDAWWKKAGARHPVFDAATEAQARQETLAVARRIQTQVKPEFSELGAFAVSPAGVTQYLPPPRAPGTFVTLDYDPAFLQQAMPQTARDCRLHIWSHFITPDLTDADTPPAGDFTGVEPAGTQESVYRSVLPGTDIAVEVQIATHDRALVQKMRQVLSSFQAERAVPRGS